MKMLKIISKDIKFSFKAILLVTFPVVFVFINSFMVRSKAELLDLDSYIGQSYTFFSFIFLIFCSLFFANLLIKEERDGTIEYLYGMSISRTQIFFSKFILSFILVCYVILLFYIFIIFRTPGISYKDIFLQNSSSLWDHFKKDYLWQMIFKMLFSCVILGQIVLFIDQIFKKYVILFVIVFFYTIFNAVSTIYRFAPFQRWIEYFTLRYWIEENFSFTPLYFVSFTLISVILVIINYIFYKRRSLIF